MRMSEDRYESEIVVEWSYWEEQEEQEHSITTTCSRTVQWFTNAVNRVAYTNDMATAKNVVMGEVDERFNQWGEMGTVFAATRRVDQTGGGHGDVTASDVWQIARSATNYTDRALGAFASTGAVARATVYGTPSRFTDATGCVWEVARNAGWSLSSYTGFTPENISSWVGPYWHGADGEMYPTDGWFLEPGGTPTDLGGEPNATTLHFSMGDELVANWTRYDILVTNLIGRVALTNDLPDTASIQSDIADLRTESTLVYRLYSGSNVVAEVTNYNSQVHAPELRLMQLNESNEYVTVWSEMNGLTRTLARANEYTDAALTNAAPRAWSRTTSGLGADAPSNTTWISTPTTVIAGGLEYAKVVDTYGEVWVLSSNGMAADFNPDTNAYFRISADDGTPVFSIEKTDAQVVGANAAGITVGETSVTVPVPVVSQDHPSCFWRYALDDVGWGDETSAPQTWDFNWTGGTGAWVLTLDFNGTRPPSLFLRFSFLQEGGVVIRNSATTDISAGIWVNGVKFVPTVSGNNLIWTKQ